MTRTGTAFSLLLISATCLLAAVPCHPAHAQSADPTLVLLNCETQESMREVIAQIEQIGGVARHRFPPHVLICELPDETAAVISGDPRVDLISNTYVNPAHVPAEYGRTARDAVIAWNNVFVAVPAALDAAPDELPGHPLVGDALLPLDETPFSPTAEQPAPAPPGAASWQTSEYMMGSVTVSLILPESDGTVDTSTEDWTGTEQSNVASETLAGLNWWATQYPYSVAPLSFTWVYNYSVATGYEPITRPQSDEGLWIADALTALGYTCTSSNYFSTARAYVNDLRNNNSTDWAFIVFVVDSSNDADDMFSDGWFGYAYLGGPFTVMTYGNDGWGISRMDRVTAHETGHIFRAGDEYSGCSSSAYYGYLQIQNTNCGTNPTCIMNNNSWATCSVTDQQLGWRDTDTDGTPDILDVAPTASLNTYAPDPTNDPTPTYTGSASVGFYPNQLHAGYDVTLNRIASVQYRINGGAWQNATPSDGAFDEGTESYTFTTSTLPDGTYTFETRATDTSGNVTASYPADTLTVNTHALSVTASVTPTTVPSGGSTSLSASASDSSGHGIASWAWAESGAGGIFTPSATAQNPTYTAPANTTGSDLPITITITATCDGITPIGDSDTLSLTVTYDYDNDGMPDYWEQTYGFDETNPANTTGDRDHDGLSNLDEYQNNADPTARDTDGDGFGDGEEVDLGSRPNDGTDTPSAGNFTDVPPTGCGDQGTDPFWAFHEIEACFRAGIVGGYTETLYEPALPVSRDQMAAFISRSICTPTGEAGLASYTPPPTPSFSDVPTTHWAYNYIEYAVANNIVAGYDAQTYRPDWLVTRGQMAVFIARAIVTPTGEAGLVGYTPPATPTFPDVTPDGDWAWCYKHVEYIAAEGIVSGYGDGYHPEYIVSRDQMAVYICRAFKLPM